MHLVKPCGKFSNYFRNKRILITGGSSGIGEAIAHDLLVHGAKVIIVSNKQDKLEDVINQFKSKGLSANAVPCDLARSENIEPLVDRILTDYGVPDIIINNAGFAVYRTFEQSSIEEIERLLQVNLFSAIKLTKLLLPEFIRRKKGSIVNMASIAGKMAITPNGAYCTAKHGLVAWSECLMYELAPFNVQVNVICPGRVLTPFFDHETFRSRSIRKETGYVVPLEHVVYSTLNAILKNRFLTYIPRTLGLLSWIKTVFPYFINPLYRRLMLNRIQSIYNSKQSKEGS